METNNLNNMTTEEIKAVEEAAKVKPIWKFNDGDFVAWDSEGDFGNEIDHCVAIQRGDNGWINIGNKLELDIYAILNPDAVTFIHESVCGFPFNYRLATNQEIEQLLCGVNDHGKIWDRENRCIYDLRKPSEESIMLAKRIICTMDDWMQFDENDVLENLEEVATEIAKLMQPDVNAELLEALKMIKDLNGGDVTGNETWFLAQQAITNYEKQQGV